MDKLLFQTTIDQLSAIKKTAKVFLGFDGFVDEIIHVVDKRQSKDSFSRIEYMKDFSEKIRAAAGYSANIEYVNIQTKLGGNGTIMANALMSLEHPMIYAGSLGFPEIHPLFQDFGEKCERVISFGEPGHTDAVEFFDGKLMFGKTTQLNNIDWDNMSKAIQIQELESLIKDVALIGFTNWTMINSMNGIMEGVNSLLSKSDERKLIFIDLADPQKRPSDEIAGVLKLMQEMQTNSDVILGMNENESRQIASILEITQDDVTIRAKEIRDALDITATVIHPLKGAAVASSGANFWVDGPYTKKPKLTTGAGDNFNAGFCHGWLSGLSPQQCLLSGVFTSGYYVRNACSPNPEQLIEFMGKYSEGL